MLEFSSNKPYLIRALYEWILDNQGTPMLIVNAEFPGVQVPQEHVKNGEIVLNVSPNAVQGLVLENDEIYFNARFSGVARVIRVPVPAVLALIARENAEGMAFAIEEMSDEEMGVEELATDSAPTSDSTTTAKEDVATPLSSVKSQQAPSSGASSKKGSHLKVVK